MLNHNVETVAAAAASDAPVGRLRAGASAVLAAAKAAGLVTKSSIMVGIGETDADRSAALADLAGIGSTSSRSASTCGRPPHHLPVARWVEPAEFDRWKQIGETLGIGHVEASPLTRSSYHAKRAADQVTPVAVARV